MLSTNVGFMVGILGIYFLKASSDFVLISGLALIVSNVIGEITLTSISKYLNQ